MAVKVQTTHQEEVTLVHGLPRLVWGAIAGGVLIAIAIECGIALLGAGIGLSLTNPIRDPQHADTLSISAIVWWLSGSLVAMYVGSWVAGHFARNHGRLHGLLMWAAKVVLMFIFLAASIGVFSAGAFAVLNPKETTEDIRYTARVLNNANFNAQQKQQPLSDAVIYNRDMTVQEVKEAAAKASDKAAKMSLLAFLMMALSAGVSVLGGAHGARDASREVAII